MVAEAIEIADVKLIKLRKFADTRGFFCEVFRKRDHEDIDFVQDNFSLSSAVGTIRGLHYQAPPFAQAKLVTVLRGAIFDVAVDMRRGSPTFGAWVGAELSLENSHQLLIPWGFAHGFCTLLPDTIVHYKVDGYYSAAHDRGILWNDPALGIGWPVAAAAAIVSEKDGSLPPLGAIDTPFVHRS
jgi:dTDP-4-dehydrorhamnose 3,5-epimerase